MNKQLEALIRRLKINAEEFSYPVLSPDDCVLLIAALEQAQQHNKELQTKLDATEAVALALRDEVRGAEKRVAELEATLELEREKSRRVMSQNHQLEASPSAVKLPNRLQPGADGPDDWYLHSDPDGEYMNADDVIEAIRAAGGQVEGE